jgi:hypothetical protein
MSYVQQPDQLVIGRKEYSIGPITLPNNHPMITLKAGLTEGYWVFSDTIRGYIGTWQITGDCLELVSLDDKYNLLSDRPVLASWFTGSIRCETGDVFATMPTYHFSYYFYDRISTYHIIEGRVVRVTVSDDRAWHERMINKGHQQPDEKWPVIQAD